MERIAKVIKLNNKIYNIWFLYSYVIFMTYLNFQTWPDVQTLMDFWLVEHHLSQNSAILLMPKTRLLFTAQDHSLT